MHDALDLAARVGPDRDHVAAAAQRDDRLLQRPRQLTGVDELLQPAAQPLVGDPDGTPQASQPRRGRVQKLTGGIEAALQRVSQARQRMDLARQVAQERSLVATQGLAEPPRRLQRHQDLDEVRRIQPAAPGRPLDPRHDVLAAPDAGAGVPGHEGTGLRRLVQSAGHDHRFGGWLESFGQAAAGREGGVGGESGAYQRQLEQCHRARVHAGSRGFGRRRDDVLSGGARGHRRDPVESDGLPATKKRHGRLSQGSSA